MKNVLIVYYTQSGQLKKVIDSVFSIFEGETKIQIDYHKIEPIEDYPFPWEKDSFYDTMPESVNGIPCQLKESQFNTEKDYDLVVLASQIWFLSPSIPFWSFLNEPKHQRFLRNKNVLTILGIRNMWVNAQTKIDVLFKSLDIKHVGNIVMADKNNNIIGVILVIQMLFTGNFKPYKFLPRYGIPLKEISQASIFGTFIKESIIKDNYCELQSKIVEHNGVFLRFSLRTTELTAGKIFSKWAAFILKKGAAKDPKRTFRLKLFKIYLLILIFFVSPFTTLAFEIIGFIFQPIIKKSLKKTKLLKQIC